MKLKNSIVMAVKLEISREISVGYIIKNLLGLCTLDSVLLGVIYVSY